MMAEPVPPPAVDRLKHLNEVLRTFRLITREKDADRMLEKACQMLIKTHGYVYAWICLADEQGKMMKIRHAGSGKAFNLLEEKLLRGDIVECVAEALKKPDTIVISSSHHFCEGCPFLNSFKDGHGFISRLEHNGRIYGTLTVYSDQKLVIKPYEQEFISDIAGDIAYSLYNFEQADIHSKEQAALSASEERYRQLFENSVSGVAVYEAVNNGGNFIFKEFNTKAEEIEQKDRADVIGKLITEAFPGVEAFGLFALLKRVWATGKPEYMSEALYRDENDPGTWRENYVYRLPGGEVVAVYNDITIRKKAEIALMEGAERHRAIFSNFPDAIFIADAQSAYIVDANPAASVLLKMPVEKIIGLHQSQLHPPEKKTEAEEIFKQHQADAEKNHPSSLSEVLVLRSDGVQVPVEIKAQLVPIDGKQYLQGVFRDITRRRESESVLKSIFKASPAGIGYVGPDRTLLKVNEKICAMTGRVAEELIGKNARILYPTTEDYEALGREKYGQIRKTGTGTVETRWQRKNGEIIDVLLSSTAIDSEDLSKGTMFSALDITERKLAANALKESEEKYRVIFESADIGLVISDFDGVVVDVNKAFTGIYGYSKAEALQMHVTQLIHKDYHHVFAEFMASVKQNGMFSGETIDLRKDGTPINMDVRGSIITVEGKPFMLALLRDITERKQAEAEITRLTQAVEQSPASIVITGLDGSIEYVNPKFSQITGYSLDEVRGSNPNILKSGDTSPDEYKEMWESIRSGKTWEGEFRNKTRDGKFFWEKATIAPIFNEKKEIVNYLAVKKDITEQKALEAQLQQSQKMEAIGLLAGGVAHDFNNLLTIINGYSTIILSEVDRSSPVFEKVKQIMAAGERATSLTRQLLAFSRKQVLRPEVLSVNQLISGMEPLLRRLIGEDIDLVILYADQLKAVKADQGQIEQVIMNLVVNARDAMPSGGCLTLETSSRFVDENQAVSHADTKPGDYIMIRISDTGMGMAKEICKQIFDPFFTTKAPGKGTGLGLSTVYGIIRQSRGWVQVDSEIGKGAAFEIFLPAIEEPGVAKIRHAVADSAKGSETIMVVEDEESVRNMTVLALTRLGYQVMQAGNGKEALEVIGKNAAKIQLVMTDVVMPQMGGPELAEQIIRQYPKINVVFISGYTDQATVSRKIQGRKIDFIQKPFSLHRLANKVRGILDQS